MSASVSFSSRVVVPDTVLFREFDDEAVVLNLDTESYLGLDAVGTRMWTVLTHQPSIQAAYNILLSSPTSHRHSACGRGALAWRDAGTQTDYPEG